MAGGLTGSLEQWPLPELLNMLGSSRQSGRVEIEEGGMRGSIYLQEGNIVHAVAPVESGIAALATLFGLRAGTFSFEPRVPSPAQTLSRPLDTLIAEVSREATEREAIKKVIASTQVRPRLSHEPPQQPVTLQPNEWRLVAAADGNVSIAEIAAGFHVDAGPIMRAYFALAQRGLVRFEAPKAAVVAPPIEPVAPTAPGAAPTPVPMPIQVATTTTPSTAAEPAATVAPAADPAPPAAPVADGVDPEEELPAPTPLPVPLLSEQFFRELARAAAGALGPLAAVIVEDAVEAHGATMDAFPRSRAAYLVESIAREIKDDRRRAEFQAHMLRLLRDLHKAA